MGDEKTVRRRNGFRLLLQHLLLPSLIVTASFFSGQSWHTSSSLIMLYLWLGARRPMAQSYNSSSVSRYYLGWPLHLLRGNSAYENLPCKAQRPKCCLYETPYYVAAPVRETGDVIARTPLYARLPTYAPTRTRFFFGSRVTHFSRDPSCSSTGSYVSFSSRKPYAKVVPRKDFFMHLRSSAKSTSSVSAWILCSDIMSWARASETRCKGFRSKEGLHYCFEQSVRNPLECDQVQIALGNCPEAVIGQATINLIHEYGNLLRIPYLSLVCYLARLKSCKKVELEDFHE